MTTKYNWSTYDFKGVKFHDVMNHIEDPKLRKATINKIVNELKIREISFDAVAGIDSRGYPIASLISDKLEKRCILVRKKGKLPEDVIETVTYKTEYSEESLTIKKSSIQKGMRVLIVDDILATGGSVKAVKSLLDKLGAETVGTVVLLDIELPKVDFNIPVISVLSLNTDLVPYKTPANERIPNKDCPYVVFSGPSMDNLANSLIFNYSHVVRKGFIDWQTFPDNWLDIKFDAHITNKKIIFFLSSDINEVFKELTLLKVLPRQGVLSIDIIIPYFAPGTMERVEKEGVVATAETFAKMISDIELTISGPVQLHLFDVHALPERFYFGSKVHVQMHSLIPTFIEMIKNEPVTICFPDEGAYKRFGNDFKNFGIPTITCSKIRKGDERIITCDDFDSTKPYAKRIIIIDDICHSGGTLYETLKVLKKKGAQQVDAFIVHGVFENVGYLDFMKGGSKEGFTNFYISDSVPTYVNVTDRKPFTLISMTDLLGSILINSEYKYQLINKEIIDFTQTNIFVASTSNIKLKGVYDSFVKTMSNCNVFGVKGIKSNVPEQPRNGDILIGVKNRFNALKEYMDTTNMDYDYLITIESGIEETIEVTKIILYSSINKRQILDSINIYEVPKQFIPDATIDPNLTAGTLIANHFGCTNDDWYQRFTGRPRASYITCSVDRLIEKDMQKIFNDLLENQLEK